jgi:SAM-dependent methyltransferase
VTIGSDRADGGRGADGADARGDGAARPGPSDPDVAPDGSPVEIYRHLPAAGEAQLIDGALSGPSDILELGAGTGRVTRGLVALGHRVVAVDNSPAMLAEIVGAETVLGDVETLRLGRTFDAVVLASHFVSTPEPERGRYVDTVAAHLRPTGVALIEGYPPGLDWQRAVGRMSRLGDVEIEVTRAVVSGTSVDATVEYRLDGRSWRQDFTADMLDEEALRELLAEHRLAWAGWLDEARGWFAARPA